MKFILFVSFFLTIMSPSFGQRGRNLLTSDLIFDRQAMKNLRFPAEAHRLEQSIRVYVGFTLTKKGNYQDVEIVNSGPITESVKQEINQFWSILPHQSRKYAGNYVVPIDFLYEEAGSDRPKEISNQEDKIVKSGKYKLLKEVTVMGYSRIRKLLTE